ncbi:MAG: M1 family metallopeptidase [Acidobacteria bacterium]|jgi:aminopeptidase N|nr:M1 family metallopeptidase [Acidobacteriota bacterium]
MTRKGFPRWLKILSLVTAILLVAILALLIGTGWYVKHQMLDSGGKLLPSMAAYDVRHYDLAVRVEPNERRISGVNTISVVVLEPIGTFEINLDGRLKVSDVSSDGTSCDYHHDNGLISVELPRPWAAGDRRSVTIRYSGEPKVALRPPWIDGFVWSETPSGAPWIGVTGQGDGGDNWWPCKDHPSDEPDEGMDIALTVPADLVGLSNGRLIEKVQNDDGTITTKWRVSYPINNYLVTVNIAPYVRIEERYHGIDGTLDEPLVFWALPEYEQYARNMWKQMPRILEVLGRRFGEYPFFNDKFAVAHAPYYGMEHQTLVAYGALFTDNDFGFDDLLLHEVAHEWWGNKITVSDWADFWIQEGFATYAEAIFVLDTLGEKRYLDYMARIRQRIENDQPIVRGKDLTSSEAYTGDIYFKGAWVLHTMRWLLGDEDFFEIIWRFANDPEYAYGLVTTGDLVDLTAEVSGRDMDWFWQRYVYRAEEPRWWLQRKPEGDRERITISWDDSSFEMPLPVRVADDILRLEMPGGRGSFLVESGSQVEVDPLGQVLATTRD